MFSIKRFSEQFLILFRQNRNRLFLILGIFAIVQIIDLFNYYYGTGRKSISETFTNGSIVAFILTILACQDVFNKLRNTPSGIQYLMTPATIVEKYSAAWLYSSLFNIGVALASYYLLQILGVAIGQSVTGYDAGFGFPENEKIWKLFLSLMFTHSVFFFGSILFKKNPIVKTLASYIGVVMIVTFSFAWVAKHYLINTMYSGDQHLSINFNGSFGSSINGYPLNAYLEFIGVNIKYILGTIAVLLWTGSYVLLNKKQI